MNILHLVNLFFKHLPVEKNIFVSWRLASLVLLFMFYFEDELTVSLLKRHELNVDDTLLPNSLLLPFEKFH